jgi:hypothetical protein
VEAGVELGVIGAGLGDAGSVLPHSLRDMDNKVSNDRIRLMAAAGWSDPCSPIK